MSGDVDEVDRGRRFVAILSSLLPTLALGPASAVAGHGAPWPGATPAPIEQLGSVLSQDAQVQELTRTIVNSLPATTLRQFEQFAQLVVSGASLEQMQQSARNIVLPDETLQLIDDLVAAGSYVLGLGFAAAAAKDFKAPLRHGSPLMTPIALVFIAAALLFLPSLLGACGKPLFGSGRA